MNVSKPLLSDFSKELCSEWDYEKNGSLTPDQVTIGSERTVWWRCKKGHSFQRMISYRVKKSECPICTCRQIIPGINDLFTVHPELADEWDYEKNDANPKLINYHSQKRVWWKCRLGHEWEATLADRTRTDGATGCPYCANKKVLTGYNDLATLRPDLAKEWNYHKNSFLPTEVTLVSGKRAWWICEEGHEWACIIASRTKSGSGCPFCSGRRSIEGENDIVSLHPEVLLDWDFEKNINIQPQQIKAGSQQKVWWRCRKCGKSFLKSAYQKIKSPYCDECSKGLQYSFPEKAVAFYIGKQFEIIENYRPEYLSGSEIDIFIPALHCGIEFDGGYYHDPQKDTKKSTMCKKQGIKLIRIRDANCPNIETTDVVIPLSKYSDAEIESAAKGVLSELGIDTEIVCIRRDRVQILEKMSFAEKENNLTITHPALCMEWDVAKNGKLLPSMFSYGSTKKVWWKCSAGHEWESSISNRAQLGRGCPFCAGKKVQGKEDFLQTNPELKSIWNYDKNLGVDTTLLSKGTHKKYWWKCKKGHEWQASIPDVLRGSRCPYCAGKKLLVGFNDLASFDELLMQEWDDEKNTIKPTEIRCGYQKKVWWKCKECGESYEQSPYKRINYGRRCPRCGYQYRSKAKDE